MEQSRKLAQQWLQNVLEGLSTGEELLLPAISKQDVKEKLKLFSNELKIMAKIDSVSASKLFITTRFKDHRFWLVMKKIADSPFIAFKRGNNGEVERVTVSDDSEKRRRLLLMLEDNLTIEEIEEIEGKLSPEELVLLI